MDNKNFILKRNSKLTDNIKAYDNQVKREEDTPLPRKSPVVYLISGAKGSGKTTLLLNELSNKNAWGGCFNNIYLVSPTCRRDKKMTDLVEELDLENKVYDEYSNENIEEIIEKIKKENEKAEEEKEPIMNCVIFDDCLSSLPKSTEKSPLNYLITNSRHLKTTCILLVQRFNKINPVIRSNADLFTLFKTNNKGELKTMENEIDIGDREFKPIYNYCTNEPNSFCHISTFSGKPKIYKNFDEIINI